MIESFKIPKSLEVPREHPTEFTPAESQFGWFWCRGVDRFFSKFGVIQIACPPASLDVAYVVILMNDDPTRSERARRWKAWSSWLAAVKHPLHVVVSASGWRQDFLERLLSQRNLVTLEMRKWTRTVDAGILREATHLSALALEGMSKLDTEALAGLTNLRALKITGVTSSVDLAPLRALSLWELEVNSYPFRRMKVHNPSVVKQLPQLRRLDLFNTTTDEPLQARVGWKSDALVSGVFPRWFFGHDDFETVASSFPRLSPEDPFLEKDIYWNLIADNAPDGPNELWPGR